jgi:hypothetical protein
LDLLLGNRQGPGNSLASTPIGDELDEVGDPALFGLKLGLLEFDGLGNIRAHPSY